MTESSQAPRHFLDLDAVPKEELRNILSHACDMKACRKGAPRGAVESGAPLTGRLLAMIFEKPSTRTRVSFEVAMQQLGGGSIILSAQDMQLGRGETIADTARVLSRYVDAIMIRTGAHDELLTLAANASVPVINGLTDRSHPCQLMADVMTYEEHNGPIAGRKIAWVGDGNNVAQSWVQAAACFDFSIHLACPEGLGPDQEVIATARAAGADIVVGDDPASAVDGADCVVTDTWVSMGDKDAERRVKLLTPFQVNAGLMARADSSALFMHCLPAHRGEEVTADVIEGPQSVVWDGAENRLHAQKAVLAWCLE